MLSPQTRGLAPHELISRLIVKAALTSFVYFSLQQQSRRCAGLGGRGMRCTTASPAAGTQSCGEPTAPQSLPAKQHLPLPGTASSLFCPILLYQPSYRTLSSRNPSHPALGNCRRLTRMLSYRETFGMCHRSAGMIHSLANGTVLTTDLCKSGRGEVSTGAGLFSGG